MKLWVENNVTENPAVYYQNDEPVNLVNSYSDKTTDIESWNSYGLRFFQWMHVRRKIQTLVISVAGSNFTNWNQLSENEKIIACKWCIAPYSLRVSFFSEQEDYDNWSVLLEKTQGWQFPSKVEGRAFIVQKMRREAGEWLRKEDWTYSQNNAFLEDVLDLMLRYIFGNDNALYQWINNQGIYLLTGFSTKNYYDSELKTTLNNIYNGYY